MLVCFSSKPFLRQFRKYSTSSNNSSAVSLHSIKIHPAERLKATTHTNIRDVLILPGLFGSGSNWRGVAKKLSDRCGVNCHLLDLRNHGHSPHTNSMTYDEMIEDIEHYIKTHKLTDPIALVGHSMGGRVSMQVALNTPQVVQKLAIVDIAPKEYPAFTTFGKYIQHMKSIDLSKLTSRREADEILKPHIPEIGTRQFLLTNLVQLSTHEFKWRANFNAIDHALPHLRLFPLKSPNMKYMGPTLFIGAAKAKYISEQDVPLLKQHFPNSKLAMVPSDHWVHAEIPDKFVEITSEFLGEK